MLLRSSLKKPQILKLLIFIMLLFSFIGFSDATYLASQHYLGKPITCSVLKGCEVVTTSEYSKIFNIPVSLFGAIYYLVIFFGLVFYLDYKQKKVLKFVGIFTVSGFIASLWFIFLQVFVIKALCFYCLISATTSTLLFIFGMYLLNFLRVVALDEHSLEEI